MLTGYLMTATPATVCSGSFGMIRERERSYLDETVSAQLRLGEARRCISRLLRSQLPEKSKEEIVKNLQRKEARQNKKQNGIPIL